jgi:hypothetical protein
LLTVALQTGRAHSAPVIDFAPGWDPEAHERLTSWIDSVAAATRLVYGELPQPSVVVEVVAHGSARETVPWARVIRGDPSRLRLYVNPSASLEQLRQDWTAYHEFAHLFIPFPGNRDIWFTEGLASYYQNVIQARAGVLTAEQAWSKLLAGFRRGAADDRMAHLTLAELSPRMWSTRSYMRVYWSGAYYWLHVDLALRRRGYSLDQALAGLRACCLRPSQTWTAGSLATRLDDIAGGSEFTRLMEAVAGSRGMPDFADLLRRHGLEADGRGIDASCAPSWVRAVMTPSQRPTNGT